jgi:hypothetical protein
VQSALQANGGNASAKAVTDAQAALGIAMALVAADQAFIDVQCTAAPAANATAPATNAAS